MLDRIREAVAAGRSARAAFYQAIGLDDEQELGAPMHPDDLRRLEDRLGRPLPTSYRMFLQSHDGWRMAGGAVDLLCVRDLLGGSRAAEIQRWREDSGARGDAVAARSLVIGASRESATRWLLDPEAADAQGEWRFVEHHHGEEESYPSFIAWLECSADQYRALAADPFDEQD